MFEKIKEIANRIEKSIQSTHPYIKIRGSDEFIKSTREALTLIQQHSPEHYEIVKNYIAVIKPDDTTCSTMYSVHPDGPTMTTNKRVAFEDPKYWYAGDIVHEAAHSKIYQENKRFRDYRPGSTWEERECYIVHKNFFLAAKAKGVNIIDAHMQIIEDSIKKRTR